MQQQIGFCSTTDGARIAYATVGDGPALVVVPYAPCHLELEWEEPRLRDFWETIGRHHLVVRYDRHGCGLSDRDRTDFSLDYEARTIEAIVKELGLNSIVLWAQGAQGAVEAIPYTIKSPDRVSRLILCNGQARWHGRMDGLGRQLFHQLRQLWLLDVRTASLATVEMILGRAYDSSALQWYLRFRKKSTTSEMLDQMSMAYLINADLRELLPKVSMPTLVVHYRNNRFIPFEAGRELAAGIPGARFVPLEDDAHIFYF